MWTDSIKGWQVLLSSNTGPRETNWIQGEKSLNSSTYALQDNKFLIVCGEALRVVGCEKQPQCTR